MNRKNLNLQLLLLLALGSELSYILILAMGDLRQSVVQFLICYGVSFVLYLIALYFFTDIKILSVQKDPSALRSTRGESTWLTAFIERLRNQTALTTREVLLIGVAFGILFRLTMLATTPSLSDDLYRYVWDGKVSSNGINPFLFAPEDPELAQLRDAEIYRNINHKEISTIYPPVTQLVFVAVFKLNPTVPAFKLVFFGLDLLTACVIALILKRLALDPRRLLLYMWNPLVIVEISGSGHADIIGIFLMTGALYLAVARKSHLANVMLAFSFLTKFFSVLLWPAITLFRKESRLVLALAFILIAAVAYLPYAGAGDQLFAGLKVYSEKWQFNALIFGSLVSVLEAWIPQQVVIALMITPFGYSPDAETLATRSTDLALMVAKGMVAIVFLAITVYYWRRLQHDFQREREVWFFKFGLLLFGWFLILNPTVQPWYVCWIVPLLVIAPNRAWLLFTALVALSYHILIRFGRSGIWQEAEWVLWAEYLPFFVLLGYDALRARDDTASTNRGI